MAVKSPQFGINGNKLYSNVAKPMEINLQFTVAVANGLGITSLKSNGYVNNVFLHTSGAPTANNGYTNPNPSAGLFMIQLKNNFNAFLGMQSSIISPNSGASTKIDNSAMTAGQIYTITILGNATLAKWQAIGVPVGVTPAVGVSFVALSDGGAVNTSTSRVQPAASSAIYKIEMIGSPQTMINSSVASNTGQVLFGQFLGPTGAALTAMIPVNPADGSIVNMKLLFDGSSVTVDGL